MSQENVEIVRRMFEAFVHCLERGNPRPALDAPEPFVEWERHKPGLRSLFDRRTGFSAGGL